MWSKRKYYIAIIILMVSIQELGGVTLPRNSKNASPFYEIGPSKIYVN